MLKWFYLANVFISVICILYYIETASTKVNFKQFCIMAFSNIANYTFASSVFADNFEGVFVAFQAYYAASIFTFIFFLLVVMDLCGFESKRWLRLGLFGFGILIIVLIGTSKDYHLYYRTMEFGHIYGISTIFKTYGPLHLITIIYIGLIDGLSIMYASIAIRNKKEVSKKIAYHLLVLLIICSITYIAPRFFYHNLDFMPFIFTLVDIMLVVLFRKANLYDISANLLNVYEEHSDIGYVVLDTKYRYLTSNDFAQKIFPHISEFEIDEENEIEGSRFCEEVIPWLKSWIAGNHEELNFSTLEYTVSCAVKDIHFNKSVIGYMIEIRDVTQHQKYITLINNYNTKLQKEVSSKTIKIEQIQNSIITGMASMVESRDNSTGGHIKRTSAGIKIFMEKIRTSEDYKDLGNSFCSKLVKAAPMHDLGKIAVDDAVLRKPGKFTIDEYNEMKKHPTEGTRIVKEVLTNVDDEEFKQIAENVAHYHHEKWDGSGYPTGIKGTKIPLEARIMAFVDVFDALVSKRCYKEAFSFDTAFEIISNDLGTHFDPELGPLFLECRPELEDLYNTFDDK